MREPSFWWREPGWQSALLAPFATGYGAIAARRMDRRGTRAPVPVFCVGNFTLGGSGKTPTAIAIAQILREAGERPFCLSRGYGGTNAGPVRVDPDRQRAAKVGDEALLLAHIVPTIVSRDRIAGARAAHDAGASVIVMDDGLQNSLIAKDLTIVTVDGRRGIGNACVFPAGPLRAPLSAQFAHADALLVVGDGDGASPVAALTQARGLPVLRGALTPEPTAAAALSQRKVLAFAGIGDPEKFFATLESAGIDAPVRRGFADHHRFSGAEAARLLKQAEKNGLDLLTTEKDLARIAGEPDLAALAARARALPVTLTMRDSDALRRLVLAKIGK